MIWDSRTATTGRPVGGQMNRQAPAGTAQNRWPVWTSTRGRASFPSLVPAGTKRPERVVASSGPRPLHLLTSSRDPFREANQRLAAELMRRGVPHQLRVLPGPHDQPWLRESGTLEMLLWHARQLT